MLALGIDTHKNMPKIQGTRFVNHRRKGMKVFLDIWPGLITAFESAIAEPRGNTEKKAKIRGFWKKWQSYEFFCKVASCVDILDTAGPASLFEGDGVMPYEIAEVVERTVEEMEDLKINSGTDEELLNSHISRFHYDAETMEIEGGYLKEGHGRKRSCNRDERKIPISGMKFSANARKVVAAAKPPL